MANQHDQRDQHNQHNQHDQHDQHDQQNRHPAQKPARPSRVKRALTVSGLLARRGMRQPVIAHVIRAARRFNDRMGNQFAAAITYFSFLSMIPLLMVSFATAGFVLASHPTLLEDIFNRILQNISDPTLANTLKNTINTAVKQRTTVGVVGLLVALYSGINWMGNLREAVSVQFRAQWQRSLQEQESLWLKYFRDLSGLIGLLLALIITLSITSAAGSAQMLLIRLLQLDHIAWLQPGWRLLGLIISLFANYLLFFWIFWRLPQQRPHKTALTRGTLIAALGFEVLKRIMTWTLPMLVKSPSGAAFGPVLGLMAFFYLFARLVLFCAAWIATADYPPATPRPRTISNPPASAPAPASVQQMPASDDDKAAPPASVQQMPASDDDKAARQGTAGARI